MSVFNPPNAVPLVLEKVPHNIAHSSWVHTKSLYRLSSDSRAVLKGCSPDMCSASIFQPPGGLQHFDSDAGLLSDSAALADAAPEQSAAEQWAELGGGW